MPELDVRLLGDFAIYSDGEPLTCVNSPRTQSLLAYLVLHRTAPQSRQQVAFLLWPDLSEARARSNLRYQLHLLRRALPDPDSCLHADELTLQWRPDAPFKSDVAAFEGFLLTADSAERQGELVEMRAALQEANNTYRGDLLPSCYDDWIVGERERLRQSLTQALERLTRLFEEAKDYRDALAVAQRLLRYDPLHESTYRSLMRIHSALGDKVSALSAFRKCAAILHAELGVEPSQPTRDLYDRLLMRETGFSGPIASTSTPRAHASTQTAIPNNLPVALSSFVGRRVEMAEVEKTMKIARLVTLTGPGGCGKTRLALQVATDMIQGRMQDAVWQISLESVRDARQIPQVTATACGIRDQKKPVINQLVDRFRDEHVLLVFDNCEHLIPACASLIDRLLGECPQLSVLATSREALGLAGEFTLPIPPLSLPDAFSVSDKWPEMLATLKTSEAVNLFVERATSNLPTFGLTEKNAAAVIEICRRLDGIPLALELAAAWVQVLSPRQIAARLDDALGLLSRGVNAALPRHRTLRAAIDWSYDLLSEPERALFRTLAVFPGSFSLEAVQAVAEPLAVEKPSRTKSASSRRPAREVAKESTELLLIMSGLVDKSLVTVRREADEESLPRFYLLDTIRQYARERLDESGGGAWVREAHARYYTSLAESADSLWGGPEQERGMQLLTRENENLEASLDWLVQAGQFETALRLARSLAWYWWNRGEAVEGLDRMMLVLARPEARADTDLHARALISASLLAWRAARLDLARSLTEEVLDVQRESGDMRAVTYSMSRLANIIWAQGDPKTAQSMFEESLKVARQLAENQAIANALNNLGELARCEGNPRAAESYLRESLLLNRELENAEGTALSEHNLAQVLLLLNQHPTASALISSALSTYNRLCHRNGIAMCLAAAAEALSAQGACLHGEARSFRYQQAAKLFGAAQSLRERISTGLDAADRISHDKYLASVQDHLGSNSFRELMEAGRSLEEEQSVPLALTWLGAITARPEHPAQDQPY